MNRVRAVGTALAVVGAGLLGLTLTAAALPTASTTRTVAWVVTSGDFANRFGTPQTLFTGDPAACGAGLLQVDVYRYDTDEHRATVDALVTAGVLTSSGQDSSVYLSSQDITLTPCATPTQEPSSTATPTLTPTATPTPSSTPSSTPTATPSSPAVPTAPSSSPTPTRTSSPSSTPTVAPTSVPSPSTTPTAGGSPTASPTRETSPTSSATPVAATVDDSGQTLQKTGTGQDTDALAYTGSNPALGFGIGFAAFTAGLILAAVGRRKGQH